MNYSDRADAIGVIDGATDPEEFTSSIRQGAQHSGIPAPDWAVDDLIDELGAGARNPADMLAMEPLAVTMLQRFATEQATMRQLAVLIARCVPVDEVMAAVASATAALLDADATHLLRFDASGGTALIAQAPEGRTVRSPRPPTSSDLAELVWSTGQPARIDGNAGCRADLAEPTRQPVRRSSIGAPITVDDRVWGALVVHWSGDALPVGVENRLDEFTDLLATAVVNGERSNRLHAARARIVLADDAARRGFERDLHDGVQQRLVSLGLELRALEALVGDGRPEVKLAIARIVDGLTDAFADLQDISHRLHPAILVQRGLPSALKTLARRSPIPVTVSVRSTPRVCHSVETAAYHVVVEALSLAAERGPTCAVWVDVDVRTDCETERSMLVLAIRHDGTGNAHAVLGSELSGLIDRVEALGGELRITGSAPNATSLLVTLPADGQPPLVA